MTKYKRNLKVVDNEVLSYKTHVATIVGDHLVVEPAFEHYSRTTSKHINYAALELGLIRIGQEEFLALEDSDFEEGRTPEQMAVLSGI